jgi:hypothetical protein
MTEKIATPPALITEENDILEVLKCLKPIVFDSKVDVGITLYFWLRNKFLETNILEKDILEKDILEKGIFKKFLEKFLEKGILEKDISEKFLKGEIKPYSIELFEDNEDNIKMWKRILRKLNLFDTHKFEIKKYCQDGTQQFHPDGRPMMQVFIKPKHSSGGGKKSSDKDSSHKPSTKGDEEKNPVNK